MNVEANENYRKAALAIANLIREGGQRSFLFASATRGEGTTTAILNVARHLKSNCGIEPLVIELDLERPVLVKFLRLDADKTFQAISSGKLTAQECIQRFAEGIATIPASASNGRSDRSVDKSKVLGQILESMGSRFDAVLVDTPPILEQADVMQVASLIPRVVLVVEAGRTRYEMLERIKRQFAAENCTIVAAILNKHKRYIPRWIYRLLVQ
ncbi:MAG: hypothetical protein V3W34_18150 [Phycisphaerae bacterium]